MRKVKKTNVLRSLVAKVRSNLRSESTERANCGFGGGSCCGTQPIHGNGGSVPRVGRSGETHWLLWQQIRLAQRRCRLRTGKLYFFTLKIIFISFTSKKIHTIVELRSVEVGIRALESSTNISTSKKFWQSNVESKKSESLLCLYNF